MKLPSTNASIDRPQIGRRINALTRNHAATVPGERVVGYVRIGEGDPLRLEQLAIEISAFAEEYNLLLGMVFTERYGMVPVLRRPALRALLDVVCYLRPTGVVVPTTWHRSGGESELASLLCTLADLNCRVFTTHAAKAAVAVGLAHHRDGQS